MARPSFDRSTVAAQGQGWDATVDDNFQKLETLIEATPFPLVLLHRASASGGSVALSGFAAADHNGCYAHLVDPDTAATNGHMIFSDGASWRYVKTYTVVS